MKIKYAERFGGWTFLIVGFIVIISAVHVSMLKDTSFILDEEIFRVMITGIIVCMTGFILLAINNIHLTLHKFTEVKRD